MAEVQDTGAPDTERQEQASPEGEGATLSDEARLLQTQQAFQEREAEVQRLTQALAQAEERLQEQATTLQRQGEELRRTLTQYRSALLAASPEVPPELVQGESAEALERSLASSQQVVARIRQQIQARLAAERVPPGAPVRSTPDASSLSPTEKILYGLRQMER
ncbi:MAG: hypothetical protein HY686_07160 [Chloroflexi bacterium]|nr:hypothetical protein [Chloroflexota bacterium]